MINEAKTKETASCVPNEYFTKKLSSEKYLITTRHRCFLILDPAEYELLRNGTFQKDCALFEKLENAGIIITEKSVKTIVHSFEKQFLYMLAPRTYRINLSNVCNLRCTYCLANAGESAEMTMSPETLDACIKFILSDPGNMLYIEFQGGEPLAKFDMIKEFVAKLRDDAKALNKKIISTAIVSNLTLMTEEIATHLLENNIGLCSSLDGPKELHDTNRRFLDGTGSYEIVTKWIAYLGKRGKKINLLPTITKHSITFGAKSIIDEYLKWNCKKINFRPVYAVGRAKDNKNLHVSEKEFIEFWKSGIEYMAELTLNGTVVYDTTIQAMLRNMYNSHKSYMCMRKPCGAGISHMSINPDGTIHPCDLAKTIPALVIGTVHDTFFDVAMRTIYLHARTLESQPLCDTCVFGPYCGSCYTRAYTRFSDTTPKTPQDFECKVHKAMYTYLFEKLLDEKYKKVFEIWIESKW